jgi:hypothetical protein
MKATLLDLRSGVCVIQNGRCLFENVAKRTTYFVVLESRLYFGQIIYETAPFLFL